MSRAFDDLKARLREPAAGFAVRVWQERLALVLRLGHVHTTRGYLDNARRGGKTLRGVLLVSAVRTPFAKTSDAPKRSR